MSWMTLDVGRPTPKAAPRLARTRPPSTGKPCAAFAQLPAKERVYAQTPTELKKLPGELEDRGRRVDTAVPLGITWAHLGATNCREASRGDPKCRMIGSRS